jgi:hypothetical protein
MGTYGAHAYAAQHISNGLSLDAFRQSFNAAITSCKPNEMTFELYGGIDAPIANAIRRILLAEVPTVAIEHVFVHQNSTLIPDEMLAYVLRPHDRASSVQLAPPAKFGLHDPNLLCISSNTRINSGTVSALFHCLSTLVHLI